MGIREIAHLSGGSDAVDPASAACYPSRRSPQGPGGVRRPEQIGERTMTIEPWQLLPYPREAHLRDETCDLTALAELVVDERAWPRLQTAAGEALAAWSEYGVHLATVPNPPLDSGVHV